MGGEDTGPFAGQASRGKLAWKQDHKVHRCQALEQIRLPIETVPSGGVYRFGPGSVRGAIQLRKLGLESLRGRSAPLCPMCCGTLEGNAVGGGAAPRRPRANLGKNEVSAEFA